MGLSFYIEDQIHQRAELVKDDAQGSIMSLCQTGPEDSVRRSIIKHGDTMLNMYQMRRLTDELSGLRDGEHGAAAAKLSEAAERAIRLRGYLYFEGD